ncbi:MAG: hypothetical protein WKF75_19435, partial [Singulisphaera sp.]
AFASFGPRNPELFVAAADGKNPKALVPHADNDSNASFSADGRWIVFTSHRGGSGDIYRVRSDGTGLERLTDDPGFDDQGSLSPDGKRLVFVSNRGGHANLWLLDLGTKKLSRLTEHDDGDFRPAWSPDGEWIAFRRPASRSQREIGIRPSIPRKSTCPPGWLRLAPVTRRKHSPAARRGPRRQEAGHLRSGTRRSREHRHARTAGTTQIATIDVQTGERSVVTAGTGENGRRDGYGGLHRLRRWRT